MRANGVERRRHFGGRIGQISCPCAASLRQLIDLRHRRGRRDAVSNDQDIGQDLRRAIGELLRNGDQIVGRVRDRVAFVGETIGHEHDRCFFRWMHLGVSLRILQRAQVPWRRQTSARGSLHGQRVGHGHLISGEQRNAYSGRPIIGFLTRIGARSREAERKRQPCTIDVGRAGDCRSITQISARHARQRMVAQPDTHVCGERIVHESIDPGAHSVEFRSTGGCGICSRT